MLCVALVCGNDGLGVLEIQPRASHMPGKHLTTELDLQPLGVTLIFWIYSCMYLSALFSCVPA